MFYEIYCTAGEDYGGSPCIDYRWRLKGRNGEKVASGEPHPTKDLAVRAVKRERGLNILREIRFHQSVHDEDRLAELAT